MIEILLWERFNIYICREHNIRVLNMDDIFTLIGHSLYIIATNLHHFYIYWFNVAIDMQLQKLKYRFPR